MTTSNKKMKQQQLGSTTGKKKNNKVCTFENFVSEGMETIGENNYQVVNKQKGSIDNASFADGSSTNATRHLQRVMMLPSSQQRVEHQAIALLIIQNAVQLAEPSKLLPTSNKSLRGQ
jgi:hypothetical protein